MPRTLKTVPEAPNANREETVADQTPLTRPTAKSIASYVTKNIAKSPAMEMSHEGPAEIVREAEYNGHKIVVKTTYRIEVDGTPVTGHMGVSNDGQVHYHAVPNMSFASAIDLVKMLIDTYPMDFPATSGGNKGSGDPKGDMGGMDHMNMPKMKKTAAKSAGSRG